MSNAQEALAKKQSELVSLEAKKDMLDIRIKNCKAAIAKLTFTVRNEQLSAFTDALDNAGIGFDELTAALSSGDFSSLQKRLMPPDDNAGSDALDESVDYCRGGVVSVPGSNPFLALYESGFRSVLPMKQVRKRGASFSPNVNLWKEIKADFEIEIINGVYAAGDRVPSIAQLAEQYKIGSTTAQKVLESLAEEGVLMNKQGVGFFVRPYVKDKLQAAHHRDLSILLADAVDYGKRIGYDKDGLASLLDGMLDKDDVE